jgi:hypothetical protein
MKFFGSSSHSNKSEHDTNSATFFMQVFTRLVELSPVILYVMMCWRRFMALIWLSNPSSWITQSLVLMVAKRHPGKHHFVCHMSCLYSMSAYMWSFQLLSGPFPQCQSGALRARSLIASWSLSLLRYASPYRSAKTSTESYQVHRTSPRPCCTWLSVGCFDWKD